MTSSVTFLRNYSHAFRYRKMITRVTHIGTARTYKMTHHRIFGKHRWLCMKT